jgi:hypothetical protein
MRHFGRRSHVTKRSLLDLGYQPIKREPDASLSDPGDRPYARAELFSGSASDAPSDGERLRSNFVARARQEADHRPHHAEYLGNVGFDLTDRRSRCLAASGFQSDHD